MKNVSSNTGSFSKIEEVEPPAVSRLVSQLGSQEDVAKDTSVGTEAVEVTDGQLDPKTGGGESGLDKNQPVMVT